MTGIGENTLAQPVKPPLRERRACLAKLVKNRLTLTPLGLLRVQNSFVVSAPRWIQPSEQGVEIGALATGEGDITDVGDDVSARHAHIWCDAQNIWHVEDLSSTNGTVVVNGATRVCIQVEPGRSAQLNPGDELKLGESTTYAILFGAL